MKRIAQKLALRAATRDVTVGVGAGIAIAGLRLLGLIGFITRSPVPISLLGGVLIAEFVLLAVCTIGVYRRSETAAFSLTGLYALRLAFAWYVSGRAIQPISLLTILIAYGLYRGIRGTSELDAMPPRPSMPLANERSCQSASSSDDEHVYIPCGANLPPCCRGGQPLHTN